MNNNNNAVVESTKSQLVELFMDFNKLEPKVKEKEKSTPQQKLAARRAIEQHFEKKRLEQDLEDYWFDD
ncbi:PA3496 family putative envelope integrity protein [Alkalimarinus coralli]|uniref:PA3496 family putative envelope integrity protein n=1 Tax=Alkalimarinus coralli TaxID=2935863 RepID=UPI00202B33CF|nr:hypothetical protein [Alkalimarinus coralli]